jgi:hypothetical protein
MASSEDYDWFPEWQRSMIGFRTLCAFLSRLAAHDAVVFGGTALCVLDRARGSARFAEAFEAGRVLPYSYERTYGERGVHGESAEDRLSLPRDVDLAVPSREHAARLLASLREPLETAGPVARFRAQATSCSTRNYMRNPLFASFFERRSYRATAECDIPADSIYACRIALKHAARSAALALDVIWPLSPSDADLRCVVAVSVYPNWMKHLSFALGPAPEGSALGSVPILPGALEATMLLPPYAQESLRLGAPSVEHLQRLAEAREIGRASCRERV